MKQRSQQILSFALSLLMLLTLLPAPAYAAEEPEAHSALPEIRISEKVSETMSQMDDLAEEEIEFVDKNKAVGAIGGAIVRRETQLIIYTYAEHTYSTEKKQREYIEKLLNYALNWGDVYKYNVLAVAYDYIYEAESGYGFFGIVFEFAFLTTRAQEDELKLKVGEIQEALQIGATTDVEKLRLVHDYLADHVEYVKADPNNADDVILHTAYSALVNGKADSLGFAMSFVYLLSYYRYLGSTPEVPVSVLEGTLDGQPHFWNSVIIRGTERESWDGEYFALDAACDAGQEEKTHFLVAPASMPEHVMNTKVTKWAEYDYDPDRIVASGPVGNNLTWELTYDGVLHIKGQGEMAMLNVVPWGEYKTDFHTIVVEEGVTAFAPYRFEKKVRHIYFPASLKRVGNFSIAYSGNAPKLHFEGDLPEDFAESIGNRDFMIYYPDHNKTWHPVVDTHDYYSINWQGNSGHVWLDWNTVTEAGCETGGVMRRLCGDCGAEWDRELKPLGHYYIYGWRSATCTEQGAREISCGRCDYHAEDQITSPLGHGWVLMNTLTPPTENTDGEGEFACNRCGETKTDKIHDYLLEITAPTCGKEGYTTHTCRYCGDSYVDMPTAMLEHVWGEGIITTEPVPGKVGIKTFTCGNCGATRTEDVRSIARISGKGRCDTALKAADELKERLGVSSFDSMILASGNNFADALAGSYLAAVKSAPILLYQAAALESVVAYIEANLTQGGTVYLLGGDAAVPEDVAQQLTDLGITVKRLSGKGRFDTNLAILNEAGVAPGQEILIATGYNYADSLSASATGLPMLLVDSKSGKLSEAQKEFLFGLSGSKLTILGGTGAVSAEIEMALGEYGEVRRLSGAGREETSALIAETYFPEAKTVMLAYSRNFPDGLSGGPLANTVKAPLILVRPGATYAASEFVAKNNVIVGYIQGGTGALSDQTVAKVFGTAEE